MANEKRLIDVDAFRDYWNKNYRHQYANDTFLFALANFPTVDAVEVVHGRWIEKQEPITWCEDDVEVFWECSICGCLNFGESNYCHNCGANMMDKE